MAILMISSVLAIASAFSAKQQRCIACHAAVLDLSSALNKTKSRLELSKDFNDKKAQKVDKVQKAQTKRWLKNEYKVALRAGIEDELEVLCSKPDITTSVELRRECDDFLDEHNEELARAVLDETAADFCADTLPGCEASFAREAIASAQKAYKSEPVPKKGKQLVRGHVTRLVGSSYTNDVRNASANVLVLLHNGRAAKKTFEYASKRYATLADEFYALAKSASSNTEFGFGISVKLPDARLRFAQLDLAKNDLPAGTPIADAKGASLVLYPIGEKESPRSVPEIGSRSLAGADADTVRSQINVLLMTHLPKDDHMAAKRLMDERRAKGEGDESPTPPAAPAKPPAERAASAPRRKAAGGGAKGAKTAFVRREECDVCLLVVGELEAALNRTKDEMALSHEAAERKQQKVDKVQKAQTKRWLKQEYKVALAASVEDRLEEVCDGDALFSCVCRDDADGARQGWSFHLNDGGVEPCVAAGKARCRMVNDEHAETLTRATLDGKGVGVCAELLPACEVERAATLRELRAGVEAAKAAAAESKPAEPEGGADREKDEV